MKKNKELRFKLKSLQFYLFVYRILAREIINAILQERDKPTDMSNDRWMSEIYKGNKY